MFEDGLYHHYPYKVYKYDKVDSTNSVAKRFIETLVDGADMSAHVAREQTNGKGRRGRKWLNTEGAAMFSIVRITKLTLARIPMLNLAAAVAVKNAVLKLTKGKVDLAIKWPNDLVTRDRFEKVCGILSESVDFLGKRYAVIGIGLNLNASKIPSGLMQPASSVRMYYGFPIGLKEAVNAILDEFEKQYALLENDREAFLKEYMKDCISLGRHVSVDNGSSIRYGVGDKLAPDGQLLVRFEDGTTDVVYSADVSIRNLEVMDKDTAVNLLPYRRADSNKGSFGKALIIAGSINMPGAALMCTKACIRSGSGLTKVLIPEEIKPSFALIPEAMLETDDGRISELLRWSNAVLIGCGMGVSDRTAALLKKVLASKKCCVIDADALNTLAKHPELTELLHEKVVITPHPAEMGRLVGKKADEVSAHMTETALTYASEHRVNVLLKSSYSVIVSPEGTVRYNESGTSGLAKGGSGDVLAGIVTAMLAQGAKPYDAALLGSYILGVSAEEALEFLNNRFVAAGDIIDIINKEIES